MKKSLIAIFLILFCLTYYVGCKSFAIYTDEEIEEKETYEEIESPVCYVTPSGEKYHNQSCQYVRKNNNRIETTVYEAKEDGYSKCSKCRVNENNKKTVRIVDKEIIKEEIELINHPKALFISLLVSGSIGGAIYLYTKENKS